MASTLAVEISTSSAPSSTWNGTPAPIEPEIIARQLEDHVLEVLTQQLRGRAHGDDVAVIHDGDDVAQEVRLLHVVGGEDDGLAARLDGADQVPEVVTRLRVETRRGLVEEQHLGIVHQRDAEQQPLQLATRELAVVTVLQLFQRADADDLVDVCAARVEVPEEQQAFAHREEFLQRRLLELDAGFLAKASTGGLAAIQHFARRRGQNALDHLDRGGLARAIGTEQAEAAALLDGERHAVHGDHVAVVLDESAGFEDGGHA